jgi:Xaa-Pro aminopeptidase
MYAKARQIIEPGIDEIDLFAQLHAAAVDIACEPLSALLGNDYSCGAGGGPPRGAKHARAGEIYILDVGPAYRGYFADASRGFAVGAQPTDAQRKAHAALAGCFEIVERLARPGVRCREVYQAVDQHLKSVAGTGLVHHLGHGIGLQPHEFPHLNPRWDDVLIEGEIFTVEPGLYGPRLAGGIRLENTYVVKRNGLENLVTAPLDL